METKLIQIPVENGTIFGDLFIPKGALALIIFAHGSGSSRFSSRNRFVAEKFHQKKFATLLFDLLTEEEDKIDQMTAELRFNIPLLSKRLVQVIDFCTKKSPDTKHLKKIGLFGSSTGAAAALVAAAERPEKIGAVVSRGGRPDLALPHLRTVTSPTLLIVGGLDLVVIDMNHTAFDLLGGEKELQIVEGATHLFEEEGKLEKVADLAAQWFANKLTEKNQYTV